MLKSNSRVIVAAIGLLVLSGNSPTPEQRPQLKRANGAAISQQASAVQLAIPGRPAFTRQDTGCKRGEDQRQSDLCAQWKAADAAYDATQQTEWQVIQGWIGLILGTITMIAALAAAAYARRAAIATEQTVDIARSTASEALNAVEIASRNAEAAVRLADITDLQTRNQFRPFVWIQAAQLSKAAESKLAVMLEIRNSGFQPAIITEIRYYFSWVIEDDHVCLISEGSEECSFILPPGPVSELPISLPLTPPDHGNRPGNFSAICELRYTDAFDREHSSPGSFCTESLRNYGDLAEGTQLVMMRRQLVPRDRNADDEQTNKSTL